MSDDRSPQDVDITHTRVPYGSGGMIVRDGLGEPMRDEVALEFALPRWAEEVPNTDVVVDVEFGLWRFVACGVCAG